HYKWKIMPSVLDNLKFNKIDPPGMIDYIDNYASQIHDALKIGAKFIVPSYYIKIKKVVFLGMGGSGIGAELVKSLLGDCPMPMECVHNYSLPAYTDSETLVVVCSYSGETEEAIAGFFESRQRNAKIIIIATGGKLKSLAGKFKIPCISYDFESTPRAAYLYSFIFLLMIFSRLGFFKLDNHLINDVFASLEKTQSKFSPDNNTISNPAKLLAEKIANKVVIIYASHLLIAVAKRFKTQINENSKNFAFFEELPELNHNAVEGYAHPQGACAIISLESNFEINRINLRQNITSDLINRNHIPYERVRFISSQTRLSEILAMLQFADYVSYYLAILNKVDPSTTSNIDYLKGRLN
ncbi:MAG: bifunctional phosphoglucose/phosphomannose isomerase, partial [bacterium]